MECEFNARLLYRDGRGVKLMEAGKKLVELGRRGFQSIDSVKEKLLISHSKFLGTVTLGLPPSFGAATISAALIRRFKTEYPDAHLRVVVAYSGALSDWLESGRIDVAVLYAVHRSATLLVTPLLTEYLYLVERAPGIEGQRTATLSELGVGSYVIPSSENGMRKILDAAAKCLRVDMKIMAEIDSLDATKGTDRVGREGRQTGGPPLRRCQYAGVAGSRHSPAQSGHQARLRGPCSWTKTKWRDLSRRACWEGGSRAAPASLSRYQCHL